MSFLTSLFAPKIPAPAPLPVAPPPPAPPVDAELRPQAAGTLFSAGEVTDTENEIDTLGAPSEVSAKRRTASSALLG